MKLEKKTLNELENKTFPKPSQSDSYLVKAIYNARNKKIESLDIEDLRILINQGLGLEFLIPRAFSILKIEPFVSGDYYEGDLLNSVLKQLSFIRENKSLFNDLLVIARKAKNEILVADLGTELETEFNQQLSKLLTQ